VALALALYLFGRVQLEAATGRRAYAALSGAAVAWVAAVALALWGAATPVGTAAASPAAEAASTLPSEPWSPARVAELRAQGRPVFVNFTADWCVTCKVNEGAALADPKVKAALARTNAVYLVADWTRRDETIARALSEQGRAGVPLYLVYRPGAAEPEVLPQWLTADAIVGALEKKG
jgi:thiol:disulfide interchange protein DsbD